MTTNGPTGDPPQSGFFGTYNNTAPCGCHTGPWWGITPAPRCAQHSAEYITTVVPSLPGVDEVTPGVFGPLTTEALRGIRGERLTTKFPSTRALLHLVGELGGQIGTKIGAAAMKGEHGTAEHDAWQLALQAMTSLKQCIDRALAAADAEDASKAPDE